MLAMLASADAEKEVLLESERMAMMRESESQRMALLRRTHSDKMALSAWPRQTPMIC